ncbi:response regulator transcription factor [Tenacibaculum sp. ZS6-P6]|uniref:response regulator transcription factor n=1 Tax=Tenacibaculum sp. ZS6-P6 TaxID=3447503 RepID=UPI003F99DAC5
MSKKIIIVEDELIVALHLKEILSEFNYDIIIGATTYEEGVKAILAQTPDLVLIDINLDSSKTGVELAKFIETKNLCPYIYITSYTDNKTLNQVKKTSPSGYIVKPFKSVDVTILVQLVLEKSNNTDYLPLSIKNVIQYIQNNIDKKIEISELATLTQWGTQHFSNIFKKYVGITPYQFIIKTKIDKAKHIIVTENINLKDLAFDLGFSSYTNFFHAFKKYVKTTPENYLRNNRTKL